MKKYILGFVVMLSIAPVLQPATATTVRAYSTQELVEAADVVAHGRVIAAEGLEGAPGRIVTDVRIAVDAYVVGRGPGEITVRLEGGELGNIVRHVPGEARLRVGEETLLFLTPLQRVEPARFQAVGLSQGVFRVIRGDGALVPMVTRSLEGLRLVDETPDGALELASSKRTLYVPLDRFIAAVRRLALPSE